MYLNRIISSLQCIRLLILVTAVMIVFGSLSFYSSNSISLPMAAIENKMEDVHTWMIQTISDRRLISTLVASQASIFYPFFILFNPIQKISFIELVCQLLMSCGLSFSWLFSILFDLKSTDLVLDNLCLSQANCELFIFVYGLKFVIVGLLIIETSLVLAQLLLTMTTDNSRIQLPLDSDNNEK
ncbi:uncharacterized protein BX663DRAFT_514091 [Cokeromyces recurvatus]|uniref:uncharacterized protein n=1 Tax=Cokeromyces recurvatus TaxID=90255 RepID=UPI002220FE75|nr:uncharacterized protein BX663DRAFT_514091 [Cokeromyces recurvatus]KAI7901317.1 hypothetical protein BX663DRAFT_514091 [Cokeromyces recurvatus]